MLNAVLKVEYFLSDVTGWWEVSVGVLPAGKSQQERIIDNSMRKWCSGDRRWFPVTVLRALFWLIPRAWIADAQLTTGQPCKLSAILTTAGQKLSTFRRSSPAMDFMWIGLTLKYINDKYMKFALTTYFLFWRILLIYRHCIQKTKSISQGTTSKSA